MKITSTNTKKIILLLCCVAAIVGEGCYWIHGRLAKNPPEKAEDSPAAQAFVDQFQAEEVAAEPEQPSCPIDFAAIRQDTPDVYAWLEIPGTDISYPVFQHPSDNSYYLEHNADGSPGRPGCIYTEKETSKDFSDFNTVIYGHDMNDLSMFGTLQYFREPGYLEEHPEIILYTPEETRRYEIFAQVIYSDDYLPAKFDWSSEAGQRAYLEALRTTAQEGKGTFDPERAAPENTLVTLSTCVDGMPENRYLVVAGYVQ